MIEYQEQTRYIGWTVEGHGGWTWPKADTDHVFETLVRDWTTRHREAYTNATSGRRKVCVQAGGNCGMYPLLLSDYFERVYTFEPDPLNFYCLVNNCQKDNIIKLQTALGIRAALADVSRRVPSNTGAHTIVFGKPHVPVITIDSLELDACDFIQLDVEGQEVEVIGGASNTLDKFRPVISAERANVSMDQYLKLAFGYRRVEVAIEDVIYVAQ